MYQDPIRLTDLVRQVGGWPIDIERVAALLERADAQLADVGGRNYAGELDDRQLQLLGFSRR